MHRELRRGGQFLIIGIPGPNLDDETRRIIDQVQPSGFILFGRNIKNPEQLHKLILDLRDSVEHEPIITIDQEGGRVSRLKEIGQEPPSVKQLRDKGDMHLFERHGHLTGRILRLFGFNLNLCPVLDVSFDDEADNSLRNRTFGRNAVEVLARARVFTEAMRGEGILSCGKHFPSYASAQVDPHHHLPEIHRTEMELESCEWIPFRELAADGQLDSIMIGHIRNRNLDPSGMVSTLSKRVVQGILRDKWGYDGCVITDDMDMGAILNEYPFEDSIKLAIAAGNDLILICHRTSLAVNAAKCLSALSEEETQHSIRRIAKMRKKLAPPYPFSLECFHEIDQQIWQLRVDTLGEAQAALRSPDDGKRSPVEIY
ncbi:MAG: glycoside hydrolase family 3 protein [Methylacidiphilales bacterium]|nr:glycoside hydrolase family 3 protein [Candidatus Methylacidiphilales bacterium]MDW8348721.1 glycoside hydrolase family 3 N-terminal domain-containing protein [Verrucomicrobiae bacterium]